MITKISTHFGVKGLRCVRFEDHFGNSVVCVGLKVVQLNRCSLLEEGVLLDTGREEVWALVPEFCCEVATDCSRFVQDEPIIVLGNSNAFVSGTFIGGLGDVVLTMYGI